MRCIFNGKMYLFNMRSFILPLSIFVISLNGIVCNREDSKTCVLSPTVIFTNYTFINDNSDVMHKNLSLFGTTTVFAFVDTTYGFEQIRLLSILQKRLKRSNFEDVQFILINSYESYGDLEGLKFMKHLAKDMYIFQETTPEVALIFGYPVTDSVFITDSCGRITYHVIPPWSFAQYPYVKAAILSTFIDDPCGPCDQFFKDSDFELEISVNHFMKLEINLIETKDAVDNSTDDNNFTSSDDFTTEIIPSSTDDDSLDDFVENSTNSDEVFTDRTSEKESETEIDTFFPFKIILHTPHVHISCDKMLKYEYLVLKFGNSTYHDHLNEPIEKELDPALLKDVFRMIAKGKKILGEEFVYLNDDVVNCSALQEMNITFVKKDQNVPNADFVFKPHSVKKSEPEEFITPYEATNDEHSDVTEDYENIKDDILSHYSKLLIWLNATI